MSNAECFDKMMRWALGDDWMTQNVKDAAKIFNERHSLYVLESLEGSCAYQKQIAFYAYQMTRFYEFSKANNLMYQKNNKVPDTTKKSFWKQLLQFGSKE